MFHLFGNILTDYGVSANNRGDNEGNIARLQKIIWKGNAHTTISAEAIRWALRYYWQNQGYKVNRCWDNEIFDHRWQNANFDKSNFIDDDVLGFMKMEAPRVEVSEQPQQNEEDENNESENSIVEENVEASKKVSKQSKATKNKLKTKKIPGTKLERRGALEVNRAVSTLPFYGDITFNAASGKKGRNSLYSTEVHATRYQYGFAITPTYLQKQFRVHAVLDGLVLIGEVAGNHARFLFDFSPDSIVLRWTHDFSPRFLYCFQQDEYGNISAPELVRRVNSGDINPQELWIGGAISEYLRDFDMERLGVKVFPGVKETVQNLKKVIAKDLMLSRKR